jgi:hypothetical protein
MMFEADNPFSSPPTDAQLKAREAMMAQLHEELRGMQDGADAVSVCLSLAAIYLCSAPRHYRLQITLEGATLLLHAVQESLETRH